jgi:hypothetical protein
MANDSGKVLRWRQRTKDKIVKAFGGECCICHYKGPRVVYDFHHLNPKEKESKITMAVSRGHSWERISKELKKCVMLCATCHRLVHGGYKEVPENSIRFNENMDR